MIDARKGSLAAGRRFVVPINLSTRVAGAFYAVYGGAALVKFMQVAQAASGSTINLLACLILGAFTLFGVLFGLSVETLAFDPTARVYEFRRGFGPFAKPVRGLVAEIKSIAIERISRVVDEPTDQTPSYVLTVRLEWIDGRTPIELFASPEQAIFGSNRVRVLAKATRISNALGIHLDDRSTGL